MQKLERTKNAKRNMLFGWINKIVTILLPFIVRTVVIYKLGSEYLGLNSLFTSILQVLSLSELGFSSAVVYSMYKPIAEQDEETICALLAFYRKVYKVIGIIILGVGVCLMPFLPNLIEGTYPADVNLYVAYLVYLVNTALSYLLFAYKSSLLTAHQRVDVTSNVLTVTTATRDIMQIIVLFIIPNYYVYVVLIPIFTLLNNIFNAVMVDRMYPQYKCSGKLTPEMLTSIKKKVAGLMIQKVCATSRNSFDSIFVSAFIGLTATAIYANYYYILNAVTSILAVISASILAGAGNSVAMESREKNYNDMNKFNFLYMWISGWCTCCLLCLYQPFMKIWVGEDLMLPMSSVILFCLYFYALKLGDIRTVYVESAGIWWENKFRAIAEAAANLILNFTLVQFFGINGIIAATLISLIAINFCYGSQLIFKYYFKNGKLWEYFRYNGWYLLVTAAACIVSYAVCGLIKWEGLLGLIVKLAICCIVPNVVYLACYYRTKQYGISIKWILESFHLEKKMGFLIPKSKKNIETNTGGNVMSSGFLKNCRKYGGSYFFSAIIDKLSRAPVKRVDLVKQSYYLNLSEEERIRELKEYFPTRTGYELNIENPQTFDEKLQWLKLYNTTPLKIKLADKLAVRDWVAEKIGEDYLIPLCRGSENGWNRFEDIDFESLPDRFVLKCAHGSAMNIIVSGGV